MASPRLRMLELPPSSPKPFFLPLALSGYSFEQMVAAGDSFWVSGLPGNSSGTETLVSWRGGGWGCYLNCPYLK